jgi:hypothetical protein
MCFIPRWPSIASGGPVTPTFANRVTKYAFIVANGEARPFQLASGPTRVMPNGRLGVIAIEIALATCATGIAISLAVAAAAAIPMKNG